MEAITQSISFKQCVQFVGNHFDVIMAINFTALFVYGVAWIGVILREVAVQTVARDRGRGLLFSSIMVGQVVLFFLFGYTYWQNYHRPAPEFHLMQNILPDTSWIRDPLRLYVVQNNTLSTVLINGRDEKPFFTADDRIKEYHFSPDGTRVLVATKKTVYLVEVATQESRVVDAVTAPVHTQDPSMAGTIDGVISAIRWAPNSRYLCYQLSRWSAYGSQDKVYVYDVVTGQKRAVYAPARRLSSLYWDTRAENLYSISQEARDISESGYRYELRIFRISLDTLTPQLLVTIPSDTADIPVDNLSMRGIDLFLRAACVSFTSTAGKERWDSPAGAYLSIDSGDYLYLVNDAWFRKRLFKISREPNISELPRHQYGGGELVLREIRWLPDGKHVIMRHKTLGIFVMDPFRLRIGHLVGVEGDLLGWYDPSAAVF